MARDIWTLTSTSAALVPDELLTEAAVSGPLENLGFEGVCL